MLKLFGAVCVMTASIGYSRYLLGNQKLHRDVLQSLISAAELLTGYIGYERLTMEEAFARLSGSCHGMAGGISNGAANGTAGKLSGSKGNGLVKGVLARMADRLADGKDESVAIIWREVFCEEASKLFLNEEELSIVLEIGKSLGGADIETQLRCLKGGARRLEKKYADAGRELTEKRRLYAYLGVAVGAMAVLVLI